ncbi:unnamed protein product [Prorocentrum cordatum]|uniref:Uncharacterized protein n=1 Tax=Prorocentrum cordatum TaxID=2364126 RepID=A0ABN9VEU0_9DINO|nr:unnamed protein product [Polarella glacialis]
MAPRRTGDGRKEGQRRRTTEGGEEKGNVLSTETRPRLQLAWCCKTATHPPSLLASTMTAKETSHRRQLQLEHRPLRGGETGARTGRPSMARSENAAIAELCHPSRTDLQESTGKEEEEGDHIPEEVRPTADLDLGQR